MTLRDMKKEHGQKPCSLHNPNFRGVMDSRREMDSVRR